MGRRDCRWFIQKELRCDICNTAQIIHRNRRSNRSKGHKKHLYCVTCRETTIHTEMRQV